MAVRIVAIHSFDTPNKNRVVPKKYVQSVQKSIPNRGPKLPRHVDVRKVAPYGNKRLNKYVHETPQSIHILVLTSAIGITLPPDPTRELIAQERFQRDPTMKLVWSSTIPRTRLRLRTVEGVKRVVVDIKDAYEVQGGKHRGNIRHSYAPKGVRLRDITADSSDPWSWKAIGCTCMDMVMRSQQEAKAGCKHILCYNKYANTNKIIPP